MKTRSLTAALAAIAAVAGTLIAASASPVGASSVHTNTVSSADNIGARSTVVHQSNGLPIILNSNYSGNSTVEVMSCSRVDCSGSNTVTDLGFAPFGDADIAMAPDGKPVIVLSTGGSVVVVKCANTKCTSFGERHTVDFGAPQSFLSFQDVSIDVRRNGTPVLAYTAADFFNAVLTTVSCTTKECSGEPVLTPLDIANGRIRSDIAVGVNEHAQVVASLDNGEGRLFRCRDSSCSSHSVEDISNDMIDPSIDSFGKEVSIVWRGRVDGVFKLDCYSFTCGPINNIAPPGFRAQANNVVAVGGFGDVVTFSGGKSQLFVVECRPLCEPTLTVSSKVARSWSALGISSGKYGITVTAPTSRGNNLLIAAIV